MGAGLVAAAMSAARSAGSPPASSPEGDGPAMSRLEQKVTPNPKSVPPTTKVELTLDHQWKTEKSATPRTTMTPITIEVPELEAPFEGDVQ